MDHSRRICSRSKLQRFGLAEDTSINSPRTVDPAVDAPDVTSVGNKATAVARPQYRNIGCFVAQHTPSLVRCRLRCRE